MIDSILFDFDYTIVDSSEGVIHCINHCFEQMGLEPADPEDIRQSIGMSLPATFTALTNSSSVEGQERFKSLFIAEANQIMLDYTHLLPGAKEALAEVAAHGLKVAIVSTKPREQVVPFCEREKLPFDVIVAAGDAPRMRPDPDPLLVAIKQLGTAPDRAVYVGDSTIDAIAANRAKIRFVAVLSGVTPRSQFDPYPRTTIVENLEQLPQAIKALK